MRIATALISLIAVVAIVGSATAVLTRKSEPRLSVTVSGVPGYVYYNRNYDLTIDYANMGGSVNGPLQLVAKLPETFALAENMSDPSKHGERLVWTLDGLDSGESGSIPITVRGTLPDDLTKAVYDLPGYEGHAAFVEGFEMAVSLTADGASAQTLAVADTGSVLSATIHVTKDFTDDSPSATAQINFNCSGTLVNPPQLTDGANPLHDGSDLEYRVTWSAGGHPNCTLSETAPGYVSNGPDDSTDCDSWASFVATSGMITARRMCRCGCEWRST
jgi:hypothetical protein